MIPTKPRKVVRIELTPDDHLENMPSFNRPKSPILKSEELAKTQRGYDEDVEDAKTYVSETHGDDEAPLDVNKPLTYLGTELRSPHDFIDDTHWFNNKPSGWLNASPVSEWNQLLEDEHDRDFSHITSHYHGKTLGPAIEIDGKFGDGRGRSIFHHAIGKPIAVAMYSSTNPGSTPKPSKNNL